MTVYLSDTDQKKVLCMNGHDMLNNYNVAGDGMINTILTVMLYLGSGWLVYKGQLSVGAVIAFLTYQSYVTSPITLIMNLKYFFSSIKPSVIRMAGFLNLEEEISGIELFDSNDFECIRLNNITYSYNDNKLIDNLNLDIKKGDKIAIVGDNGSGKTTLIQLLLQFMRPHSGKIYINEKEINSINLRDYRELFSVVTQNVFLFSEALICNLDLKKKCSLSEIILACKKYGVEDIVKTLAQGYNTKLDENRINLSGGERQKLALVRAIIKDSEILILDEATSNYDTISVRFVIEKLLEEYKEKTIIMITHDSTLLHNVDKVYTLQSGTLHLEN